MVLKSSVFYKLSSWISCLLIFHVSILFASAECTFKDVGQGHCVLFKVFDEATQLPTHLIIADAGSSANNILHQRTPLGSTLATEIKGKIQEAISNANCKIVFFVSHADKDHISLYQHIINNSIADLQVRPDISIYLGGPLDHYFGSDTGVNFIQTCLNLKNADIQSISHYANRQAIQRIIRGETDYQSKVEKLQPRPFLVHHYLPEFDGAIQAQILAANSGHFGELKINLQNERFVKARKSASSMEDSEDIQQILKDPNTNSAILRIEFPQGSIVLPGDSNRQTIERLKAILNAYLPSQSLQEKQAKKDHRKQQIEATILLASHHGATTHGANNAESFALFNPQYVIFSGSHTGYKHPDSNAVISALHALKAHSQSTQQRHSLDHKIAFYDPTERKEVAGTLEPKGAGESEEEAEEESESEEAEESEEEVTEAEQKWNGIQQDMYESYFNTSEQMYKIGKFLTLQTGYPIYTTLTSGDIAFTIRNGQINQLKFEHNLSHTQATPS